MKIKQTQAYSKRHQKYKARTIPSSKEQGQRSKIIRKLVAAIKELKKSKDNNVI